MLFYVPGMTAEIETLPLPDALQACRDHHKMGQYHLALPIASAESQDPTAFRCGCGWTVNVLNPL